MIKKGKFPTNNLLGIAASVSRGENEGKFVHKIVSNKSITSIRELHEGTYSADDLVMVLRTAIGCCKFILESYSNSNPVKVRARKSKKKEIATWSILEYMGKSAKFRPNELISNFPPEIKKMQRSDVSQRLRELVHSRVLDKTKGQPIRKKRGHPRRSDDEVSVPGPKSYYERSEFLSSIARVFVKPAPRKALFWLLMDSGLLRRYIYGMELSLLYQVKFQSRELDEKKDSINYKAVGKIRDRLVEIKGMDDSAIKKAAAENAQTVYHLLTDDSGYMLHLYVKGALCFFGFPFV